MRKAEAWAAVVAVGVISALGGAAPAQSASAQSASNSGATAGSAPSRFDGAWSVTLSCPASDDGRALAFSFPFDAVVNDSILHGERGARGQPGWMQLDGPIAADGSASLVAEGLTGIPRYALNNVQQGTRYRYAVRAQLEATTGSGSWTTIRTCTFAFARP